QPAVARRALARPVAAHAGRRVRHGAAHRGGGRDGPYRRAECTRCPLDFRPGAGDGTGAKIHGRPGRRGAHRSTHPPGLSRRQHPTDGGIGSKGNMSNGRLAVDIGGTFTDLCLDWRGKLTSVKVLTTPRAPEEGVLTGMDEVVQHSGIKPSELGLVIHGTTLATNAIIERKGAKTALVVTEGFRDSIEIAFEHRFEQYDIFMLKPPPLVPRDLRF